MIQPNPYILLLLILASFLAYAMIVDKNVSDYFLLSIERLKVNYQRLLFRIKTYPSLQYDYMVRSIRLKWIKFQYGKRAKYAPGGMGRTSSNATGD
jgi:hypothetical protein